MSYFIAKFITALLQCVLDYHKNGSVAVKTRSSGRDNGLTALGQEESTKENIATNYEELEEDNLATGLLEVAVILLEGIRPLLKKPSNTGIRNKLTEDMATRLPLLFDSYKVSYLIPPLTLLVSLFISLSLCVVRMMMLVEHSISLPRSCLRRV